MPPSLHRTGNPVIEPTSF